MSRFNCPHLGRPVLQGKLEHKRGRSMCFEFLVCRYDESWVGISSRSEVGDTEEVWCSKLGNGSYPRHPTLQRLR